VRYIGCSVYIICNKEQFDAYLAHVPLFHVPSYIFTAVLEPLTSGHAKTLLLLLLLLTGACVVGAGVGVAVRVFLPDFLLF
jgi:predicted permease